MQASKTDYSHEGRHQGQEEHLGSHSFLNSAAKLQLREERSASVGSVARYNDLFPDSEITDSYRLGPDSSLATSRNRKPGNPDLGPDIPEQPLRR